MIPYINWGKIIVYIRISPSSSGLFVFLLYKNLFLTFQAIPPQISDASRRRSSTTGRADRLPALFHVVGQHGSDTRAASLAALLRLRPGGVWPAHALWPGASEEFELAAGETFP